MGILFGLVGLATMLAILAGVVVFVIFMARKVGLLKAAGNNIDAGQDQSNILKKVFRDIQWLGHSMFWRFALVAALIALMTIPLSMVKDVVYERNNLYNSVQSEVAATWGQRQQLRGPALLVPYTERFDTVEVLTDKEGNETKKNKTVYKHRTAIVLPDDLNIEVNLLGQSRKRSIYETLVYNADVTIEGKFTRPNIESLSDHIDIIHWDRAWFSLGISDTQSINKVSALSWGSQAQLIDFEPGTKITKAISSGFHAPMKLNPAAQDSDSSLRINLPFSLDININGSQGFYFSPFGKTTNVSIQSDWPHPSFQGNVLPDEHDIQQDGFVAKWSVPHLARNYPQLWTLETQDFDLEEFSAGVNLFESVSLYSQITRAIKYGVLFLVLTYVTFLLFEMGLGHRLHIIQYGVIGLALSIFYLTLLSLSEHAGFFKAYWSAATIIITMISLYVLAAIRNISRTSIITLLLTGLYGLLFTMLRLEDYALLTGSALLLVALAAMMYLTRNFGRQNHAE